MGRAFPTEAVGFVWMYAVDSVLGCTLGFDVWLSGGAEHTGVLGKRATGRPRHRLYIYTVYRVAQG